MRLQGYSGTHPLYGASRVTSPQDRLAVVREIRDATTERLEASYDREAPYRARTRARARG